MVTLSDLQQRPVDELLGDEADLLLRTQPKVSRDRLHTFERLQTVYEASRRLAVMSKHPDQ